MEENCYVAIRKDTHSGKEWMDISTMSGCGDEVRRKADETDKKIPEWAKANPVLRVVEVRCTTGATVWEPSWSKP
jgi:hypothetical protein